MGAGRARKEARKRKFGVTEAHPESSGVEPKKSAAPAKEPTQNLSSESLSIAKVKRQRFIVFVGNLPYAATDASIHEHFAKVRPDQVRHRVDRTTGKSKGFAFLEFGRYDRMKTCLQLYHHSSFNDGKNPERRLNVELTVGGGGAKSKDRKLKLTTKNKKLQLERERHVTSTNEGHETSSENKDGAHERAVNESHIHPSRADRVAVR